jgi:hypothetical protein
MKAYQIWQHRWDRLEAERGPTTRAEGGDSDAGAYESPNYLDRVILKGGAPVL